MRSPSDETYRTLTVSRTASGRLEARNVRGGSLLVETSGGTGFTPTELFMASIASCTAADVDALTSRRAEPETFEVQVEGHKVRDESGNRLVDVAVTFRVVFPDGSAGDAAREVLPEAVSRSHDRLCTVGRTVEAGTPIATRIEG